MKRLSPGILLVVGLCLAGCSRKQEPATAPSEAVQPEPPQEEELKEKQAAPEATEEHESRGSSGEDWEDSGDESLDMDEGAAPAPVDRAPASKRAKAQIDDSALTLRSAEQRLSARVSQLDAALRQSGRDCVGAGRHRQAICDIAEQICGLLDDEAHRADTRDPERTCRDARSKCSSARTKYRKQCE